MSFSEKTLLLAEEVATELERVEAQPLIIGAVAMAARGYPRETRDLDFAVNLPVERLREVAQAFSERGLDSELKEPDGDDPLGGVLRIKSGRELVEVVSFDNPPSGGFPRLVTDALESATKIEGLPGLVAAPIDLILFKLYAGGPKSRNDILHLLEVVELDLDEITRRAKTARILEKEWTRILRDLAED